MLDALHRPVLIRISLPVRSTHRNHFIKQRFFVNIVFPDDRWTSKCPLISRKDSISAHRIL